MGGKTEDSVGAQRDNMVEERCRKSCGKNQNRRKLKSSEEFGFLNQMAEYKDQKGGVTNKMDGV